MQPLLSAALAIYMIFYAFEGAIRYGFHLVGADMLIFIRDGLLILPLLCIFLKQFTQRKVHPAFLIFFFIILVHGTVMMLNLGNLPAVGYSAKMLITALAGAIVGTAVLKPSRKILILFFIIWAVGWIGILLEKYYVDWPWVGMETSIGDVQVHLSRDWQVTGADKRAAGFTRSSINAATLMPLLAIVLLFNLRSLPLRAAIVLLTIPAVYWTTQKGTILAYAITLGLLILNRKHPINWLRAGIVFAIALCIFLPVVLPGYTMPSDTGGVFSLTSFYLRIEWMWPDAWKWIHGHEAFPFGVGLGGIGGAQRLYMSVNEMNAADNLFVFMYGEFGIMTFIYLGAAVIFTLKAAVTDETTEAMAILCFLFFYGCVISLLEDQMASLFLGAALACLRKKQQNPQPVPLPQTYETS